MGSYITLSSYDLHKTNTTKNIIWYEKVFFNKVTIVFLDSLFLFRYHRFVNVI